MNIYPVVIVNDRYNGTYSGGKWTAFHEYDVPEGCYSDDVSCAEFWTLAQEMKTGIGNTPQDALDNLITKVNP